MMTLYDTKRLNTGSKNAAVYYAVAYRRINIALTALLDRGAGAVHPMCCMAAVP